MEMRKLLGMAVLGLAIVSLGACGDDTTAEPDGGGNPDGGMPDGSDPDADTDPLPDPVDAGEANVSCRGERAFPTGTEEQDVIFELREFTANDGKRGPLLQGICVEVFADNIIPPPSELTQDPATCNVANGGKTDENGRVIVKAVPGTYVAYYSHEMNGIPKTGRYAGMERPYIAYGGGLYKVPEEADKAVEGITIGIALRNAIPMILNATADPEKGAVTGEVQDCDERPIIGATVRTIVNGEVLASTDFEDANKFNYKMAYFVAGNPSRNQLSTNTDGLFLALNIPGENLSKALLASCLPNGEVLGCIEAQVIHEGVLSTGIPPAFSDGPACPANACQ